MGINIPSIIIGGLGVIIVVLQSVQSLFQFQTNWISYRSTAEALKREKYLFQAKAGDYSNLQTADTLLAESVELLISSETSNWTLTMQESAKQKK